MKNSFTVSTTKERAIFCLNKNITVKQKSGMPPAGTVDLGSKENRHRKAINQAGDVA